MDALPLNIRNNMAKKAAKDARAATAREKLKSMRASSGSIEVRHLPPFTARYVPHSASN